MSTNYPVNPRVRAYGKARLDIAVRARTADDWQRLWVQPTLDFPFAWGPTWKHCVEYKVDDFAAEVGFFTDVLSLSVYALDPQYAMFTSPQGDFYFAVVPANPESGSTPADAIRLQFMLADVHATAHALEQRGITFDQLPEPIQPDSSLSIGSFRTPHGISIDLWGMVEPDSPPDKITLQNQDEQDGDDDEDDELEEEMPDDDEELIPDDEEEQEDDDPVEDGEELIDDEEMVEEEDLVEDEEDQGDEFIDDEEEDEDLIFDEGEGEGELDEDDEDYLFDEDDDFKDDED